jgi:hypothetical protein
MQCTTAAPYLYAASAGFPEEKLYATAEHWTITFGLLTPMPIKAFTSK